MWDATNCNNKWVAHTVKTYLFATFDTLRRSSIDTAASLSFFSKGTRGGEDVTGPLERFDDFCSKVIECRFEGRELCFDLITTLVLLDVHEFVKGAVCKALSNFLPFGCRTALLSTFCVIALNTNPFGIRPN